MINLFFVLGACMKIKLNSVALSANILIFRVFPNICFRSYFIIIVASHASDNANLYVPSTDSTALMDLILEKSIRLASSYLSFRNIMYPTCDAL